MSEEKPYTPYMHPACLRAAGIQPEIKKTAIHRDALKAVAMESKMDYREKVITTKTPAPIVNPEQVAEKLFFETMDKNFAEMRALKDKYKHLE